MSRIMLIGEAPGESEDKSGQPFVGRAGKVLDKMLNSASIDPDKDIYTSNVVKCRPPENRNPTDIDISSCFPILKKQIEIIKTA